MKRHIVPAVAIALLASSAVVAQEARPQTQGRDTASRTQSQTDTQDRSQLQRQAGQQAQGQQRQQAGEGMLDSHIAARLVLGNHEEIALSQFAQQRAQNEQVKEFAQMMVQEHQQLNQRLQPLAPQGVSLEIQGGQGAGQSGLEGRQGATQQQQRSATTQQQARAQPQQSQQPGGAAQVQSDAQQSGRVDRQLERASFDRPGQQESLGAAGRQLLELEKDIVQQCVALTQRELSEKQGQEFDKAFMGQQIVTHIGMLAKLAAAEKHASGQLQQLIQQGQQSTQQHLDMAKQIMQQLDQTASAQRGAETSRQ